MSPAKNPRRLRYTGRLRESRHQRKSSLYSAASSRREHTMASYQAFGKKPSMLENRDKAKSRRLLVGDLSILFLLLFWAYNLEAR